MTPLERLGLEVAARSLLGHRGNAILLRALIEANGRTVSKAALNEVRAVKGYLNGATSNAVRVRLCWLKAALADVGLSGVIVNHFGQGYALPEPGRTAVIARLIEEAETC